jgi:hypothetical protein
MVTMVLRAGSPYMQLGHLKELARLTGVIARSSYQGQWYAWSLLTAVTNFPSLTHCGRVTQICVCTLQRCKTGDANLRFNPYPANVEYKVSS